jgi:hypothetical protein
VFLICCLNFISCSVDHDTFLASMNFQTPQEQFYEQLNFDGPKQEYEQQNA